MKNYIRNSKNIKFLILPILVAFAAYFIWMKYEVDLNADSQLSNQISESSEFANPSTSSDKVTTIETESTNESEITIEDTTQPLESTTFEVLNPDAKTKVIFTFDDGSISQFNTAYPILTEAGFRATAYVVRDFVIKDSPEFMNLEQLKQLYDAGWDISNHTSTHELVAKSDQPDDLMRSKSIFLDNQNWIIQEIGSRGAFHAAYPFGNYTNKLAEILSELGVLTSRTTARNNAENQISYSDNMYLLPIQPLEGADAYKTAENAIGSAIQNEQSVIFMIHKIEPELIEYSMTIEDLKNVVNLVKQYSDAGQISVMTMSEWARLPGTPDAPQITIDDSANTVDGLTVEMEYSIDGRGFEPYGPEGFSTVDLNGNHTLTVRMEESEQAPHGLPISVFFTD